MTTYAEPVRAYEAVLSDSGNLSYENVTLASGAGSLVAGSVIGKKSFVQAAAPIPTIVGTGSGTMTLLRFGPDVQVGSYVITLLATSATAAFSVVAPDGTVLPNGAVQTAYKSSHLSFTIGNGGTMTIGDAFTVVVSAAGTPAIVGTGSGAMSGITLGKSAQLGTYKVRVVATSATSALEVTAPNGTVLAEGKIAVAYVNDHVNFTVADGGTMTLNDYYNIIVANQSGVTGRCLLCDPLAVDGTQNPYGVLVEAEDATSAAVSAKAIVRLGEIKTSALTWKSTVTAAQKTALLNQLAASSAVVARA